MARSVLLAVLLVASACEGGPTLRCDDGSCSPPPSSEDAGAPLVESDAGSVAADASVAAAPDAGGWSLGPPGSMPPPGCDAASGECDAWAEELVRLLDGARSCPAPLATDGAARTIAQRQADYQAEVDRLTGASPDGDLFDQLRAEGGAFSDAGAMFGATREGPSELVARWRANPDTAPLLAQCWTHAGAAFSTSASGASYATVVVVSR